MVDNCLNIANEIKGCTLCSLSKSRKEAVPGSGSFFAEIMFVGEAPGYYEDQEGIPFVGRAGNLLDEMLQSIKLNRDDVFITNMLKCRPPSNRDPLDDELFACSQYLERQIEAVSPKVIVTLGRFSFGRFFPGELISKSRGIPREWKELLVFPMYHPAAALRNSKYKDALESDFAKLSELLRSSTETSNESTNGEHYENPKQLNLF